MLALLPLLSFFGQALFFATMMLFGETYGGSEESSLYRNYWIILSILTILFLFKVLFFSNNVIKKKIIIAAYIITILFIYIFSVNFIRFPFEVSTIQFTYAIYFLVYSFFPFFLGVYTSDDSYVRKNLYKLLRWIVPILLIILASNAISYSDSGYLSNGGGMNRLTVGYLAVQLIGISMIIITDKKELSRLQLIFWSLNILLGLLIVIFSASRGPFIALIFLILFYGYELMKEKTNKKYFKISFGVISVLVFCGVITKSNYFEVSLQRILTLFSLDSSKVVDVTNGRSAMYEKGLEFFKNSPIFGNGGQYFLIKSGYDIYPHNIVIEILSDFGLVGIIVFGSGIVYLIFNLIYSSKKDQFSKIVLVMLLIKLVELNFSGSFTTTPQLWFLIGFGLFSKSIVKKGIS